MLDIDCIKIKSLETEMDDKHFIFKITILNECDRTVYVYSEVRRYLYNNDTKNLTICLHDNYITEDHILSKHLKEPMMQELPRSGDSMLILKLPKTIKRIKSASERQGDNDMVEQLNISEAIEVDLEIAHQDTPFYYNPKMNNARQLNQWGKKVVKSHFKLKDSDSKPNKKKK